MTKLNSWKKKIVKKVQADELQKAITYARRLASRRKLHDEIAEFLNDIGIILGKEIQRHEEALLVFDAAFRLAKDKK